MKRSTLRTLFILPMLLTIFLSTAQADEPARFGISTGSLSNIQPMVASNADGDVLVVWTQIDPNDDRATSAMMRFFTRNNKGGYSAGPVQQLNPVSEPALNANVAFHEDYGIFLATWSKKSLESSGIIRDNDLRARIVSSDGTMETVVRMVDSEHDDDWAFPIPIPKKHTVNKKAAFMIAFTRLGKDWERRGVSGLWTVLLDKDGRQVAAPKQVSVGDSERLSSSGFSFAMYNNRATSAIFIEKKKQFVIFTDHFHPPFDNPSSDTWLSVVTPTGAKKNLIQVTEPKTFLAQIVQLSSKRLIVAWQNNGSAGVFNRVFKTNLKPRKAAYSPIPGNNGLWGSRITKLGNDSGSFQVLADAQTLYGAYMRDNGKIKGKPYLLRANNAAMTFMNTTAVSGTNDVFLVIQLTVGGVARLEAIVFDPLEDNLTKASPEDFAAPSSAYEDRRPGRAFATPGVSFKKAR